MIKYSLIIPCFNEAQNLRKLIKKCEAITEADDIEVIIVNNGSTDNSSEILGKLLSKPSRISIVEIRKNIGYGHGIIFGIKKAKGEIIGWTHGDIQSDPTDFLRGITYFTAGKKNIFVKGLRKKRPLIDILLTFGMSVFVSILFKKSFFDINAQPTIFHKIFLKDIKSPPKDFSLDLFFYALARQKKMPIYRFPVFFKKRERGLSSWNVYWYSKFKFTLLTLKSCFSIYKNIKKN